MGARRRNAWRAIGITDFAQDSLGDVVFVQLPDVGVDIVAGASVAEIESTKSVSDVYVPVSGAVDRGQRARWSTRPSWSTRIPTAQAGSSRSPWPIPSELDALLDADAYQALIGEPT